MRTFEIILAVWWGLALVATVANVVLTPRLRETARTRGPLVSVVIPARNEERAIERTVRAFLSQTYEDLEVVVVDDRSTDATRRILASFDDPRLAVVDGTETPDGWLGKPWALEQGGRRAKGELLLFVDADVFYKPPTIAAMVEALESDVALLALFPHVEMHGFWEHAGMTSLVIVLMGLANPWLINRTRTPSMALGAGTGNLVRRTAWESIGGHAPLRDAVVDDIGLARQVRVAGLRTTVSSANDFISVRMYHGLREIVGGFTKNGFAALAGSYAALLLLVAYMLASSIVPYVLAFLGHPFAVAAVLLLTAARVALFSWLGYSIAAALFLHPVTTLLWIFILLRSAWYSGVRGEVHWRGRRSVEWSRFGR